jgi:hypothetical protein
LNTRKYITVRYIFLADIFSSSSSNQAKNKNLKTKSLISTLLFIRNEIEIEFDD